MAEGQANADASNQVEAAGKRSRRRKAPTCADCFFGRRKLCALGLDEPCPTFRPDTPRGLVPPRQPALLMREANRSAPGAWRPAAI